MSSNTITQRLKALVNNFETHTNIFRTIINFKDREFATFKYQFKLDESENEVNFFDMIFKVEDFYHNVLPLEEQKVTFKLTKKNKYTEKVIESFCTVQVETVQAKQELKALNRSIKALGELSQKDIRTLVKDLIVNLEQTNEHSSSSKDAVEQAEYEIAPIANEMNEQKENLYNATEIYSKALKDAQAEFELSEEYVNLKRLEDELLTARSKFFAKREEVDKKHRVKEKAKEYTSTKERWFSTKEKFTSLVFKTCNKFGLPLTFKYRYNDVQELEQSKVEVQK
jgi:hypothetical protein